MDIFIVSLGSRGDVQPYLALAVRLQARGHRVLFSAPERFQGFVEEQDIAYAFMRDDFLQIMDTDIGKEVMEDGKGAWTAIKATLQLYRRLKPMVLSIIEDMWRAARDFQPGLIIAGSKGGLVEPVADILNCPLIYAMPVMQMVPTGEQPAVGFPLVFGKRYNRFSYSIVNTFMGLYLGWLNEFRARAGNLPRKPRRLKLTQRMDGSFAPVLHCFSGHLCPRPNDWPEYAQVNGFWILDTQSHFVPPADLLKFLEAGDPPLYVGFGSISGKNPERTTRIIVEAVQNVGARCILATGWGGMADLGKLPDTVFRLQQVPHDWLFPRVAAVVHHGGAGTTAAGLRAGRPTLICPFFADQPFWGNQVHLAGAGPAPIPQKKLSVDRLTHALHTLLFDPSMRVRAAEIQQRLLNEDGLTSTAEFIESWTSTTPR